MLTKSQLKPQLIFWYLCNFSLNFKYHRYPLSSLVLTLVPQQTAFEIFSRNTTPPLNFWSSKLFLHTMIMICDPGIYIFCALLLTWDPFYFFFFTHLLILSFYFRRCLRNQRECNTMKMKKAINMSVWNQLRKWDLIY